MVRKEGKIGKAVVEEYGTVAIVKNGTLQYVPVRPLKNTRGMIPGLDTRNLRDEHDRM